MARLAALDTVLTHSQLATPATGASALVVYHNLHTLRCGKRYVGEVSLEGGGYGFGLIIGDIDRGRVSLIFRLYDLHLVCSARKFKVSREGQRSDQLTIDI